MQAKETPRCFTLIAGCCAEDRCKDGNGKCGCSANCDCPKDCLCKRTDIRVPAQLGGGKGWLFALSAVVLAASVGVGYYMKNKK